VKIRKKKNLRFVEEKYAVKESCELKAINEKKKKKEKNLIEMVETPEHYV